TQLGIGRRVIMGMHINDGITGLLDARLRNLENRTRLVVFKQDFVRRCLGHGNDSRGGEQKQRRVERWHWAGGWVSHARWMVAAAPLTANRKGSPFATSRA